MIKRGRGKGTYTIIIVYLQDFNRPTISQKKAPLVLFHIYNNNRSVTFNQVATIEPTRDLRLESSLTTTSQTV